MSFGKLGAMGRGMGHLGVLGSVNNLAQLLSTLQGSTVWAKLISLYVAQPSQSETLQDIKGANDLTAVNNPTFTANRGFTGDGVSAHLIGPTYTAGFASGGYAQNNASVGVWSGLDVTTGVGGSGGGIIGTDAAGAVVLFNAADANYSAAIRANSSPSDNLPAPSAINLVAFSRGASGSYKGFVNKQKSIIATASTGTPGTQRLTFLRSNTTYTTNRIAAAWIGLDLTDDEFAFLVTAVNRYLAAIGAFDSSKWGIDGVWTWFNDQRAILLNSGKVAIGANTRNGQPVIAQNESNGLITRGILHARIGVDDHDNPALLRRASDGKIIAHYCGHGSDANYYQRISSNADDISTWGSETNIGTQFVGAGSIDKFAYANLFQLTGESNKLFSFFRAKFSADASDWTTHYSTSSDDGATWAQGARLFWSGRPYFKAARNGTTRIDILLSQGNPTDTPGSPCNIYHCYYEGGAFYTSAGISMGSPPYTTSQPTVVYDSTSSGLPAWNWDIVIDGSNNPVACFSVFQTATDHRYHQARWSGSAWVDHEICAAGRDIYPIADRSEIYYSGGVITDPDDVNTVYCSRQVDGNGNIDTSNGVFQLFKYVSADNGATWTGTQLTFGTEYCFRPYIPIGSRTLLYCTGSYTSYLNYRTRIESLAID
jgi:hypothetical protein